MGLAERRAVKKFESGTYPDLLSQIRGAVGFDVEVQVEWDTLEVDELDHMYDDAFPKVFFKPVIEALREVCVDDLGKEALAAKLKVVHVRNTGVTKLAFEGGVLLVDHHPTTNIEQWKERRDDLREAMQAAL